MLDLGTPAAEFQLPDSVSGKTVGLADFTGKKALLVMFLSRHCPYVKHILQGLADFTRDYAGTALGIVAISSNFVEQYPDDAPDKLRQTAHDLGFHFPFCYDESQEVARAYRAACTPGFFVFDEGRKLVYRGQFDASRPGNNVPVTGQDLHAAVDAVLAGRAVDAMQKPSLGCNIKWKPGNEPMFA
jgi:peroxiredoxin